MIVLDVHALLWMDSGDASLGPAAASSSGPGRRAKQPPAPSRNWERAMLHQRGLIVLPCPADVWRADLIGAGVVEIALDGRIALLAAALGDLHRDPADRFIVATALRRGAILVIADSKLLDWPSELARQEARTCTYPSKIR